MKFVDTSVAIDHLRGFDPATRLLAFLLEKGESLVSSELVRFELLAGVQKKEAADLEEFFSVLSWVPVDQQTARLAGSLARQFRRSHNGIDAVDYLIAATCILLDCDLLTQNVRHFPMLKGLQAAY